jgi:alpha-beta hydrolase superfamily lysophospholipase
MARHEEGFFTAKDNLRLYWESDAPVAEPKAVVGVIHGFADHLGRYRLTRAALVEAGLAVDAFDFRGHGRSEGQRGHVDSFGQYVDELERFFERMKDGAPKRPAFILAHSMGALIALSFLLERKPAGLAGLVCSSPFLGFAFDPPLVKVAAAKLLDRVLPALTMGNGLKVEELSRDPQWQASTAQDPLYHHVVSSRWFNEATKTQGQVLALGRRVELPLLVLTGSEDKIASVKTTRGFLETIGSKDKQYKEYPGMRHEVLNELGKEEVVGEIVRWISSHL